LHIWSAELQFKINWIIYKFKLNNVTENNRYINTLSRNNQYVLEATSEDQIFLNYSQIETSELF